MDSVRMPFMACHARCHDTADTVVVRELAPALDLHLRECRQLPSSERLPSLDQFNLHSPHPYTVVFWLSTLGTQQPTSRVGDGKYLRSPTPPRPFVGHNPGGQPM